MPADRAGAPEIAAVVRRYRWQVVASGALAAVAAGVLWPLLPFGPLLEVVGVALAVVVGTLVAGVVWYPGLPDQLVISVQHRPSGTRYTTSETTVLTAFLPVLLQLVLTAVLLLMVRWTMGARAELDPARPHESSQRHRRFLRIWAYS